MKKAPRKFFLIFNTETCRNLAVIEAGSRGDAVMKAHLVTHLMSGAPSNAGLIDATRIKHSGQPIGIPTFLDGFFRCLSDVLAA